MQKKITIILGAGASRSYGVPLTREFLPLIYYLSFFKKFEIEKPSFPTGLEEIIEKLHFSCMEVSESFSNSIITSLSHKNIDKELINILINFFFQISNYRMKVDQFLGQTSNETLKHLFENVKLLSPYEKSLLKEYIDRLMFLLGKELMDGNSLPKEMIEIFPNLEDLMSCFDIKFLINSITPIGNLFDNIETIKNEKSMFHAIMAILCLTSGKIKSPLIKKDSIDHYKFIANAIKENKRNTTFISFNYDSLLDNILEELHIPFSYGIDIQNRDNPEDFYCNILKLHGSANIWQCKNCFSNFFYEVESLEDYCKLFKNRNLNWEIPGINCCSNPILYPLIVPPTMIKTMGNLSLLKLWIIAEKELEKSQTLIFIGYSIPKEDVMARNLIKRAILRSNNLEYIIYINKNPAPLDFIKEILLDTEKKPIIFSFINDDGLAEVQIPNLFNF